MKLSYGEELRRAQERGRERQRRNLRASQRARRIREEREAAKAHKFVKPVNPTFPKCGHPRTPENTFWTGHYQRCLTCKREAAAQYMREHREPISGTRIVPIYKDARDRKTLLEELWKPIPQY